MIILCLSVLVVLTCSLGSEGVLIEVKGQFFFPTCIPSCLPLPLPLPLPEDGSVAVGSPEVGGRGGEE